ncbi:YhdH/YhfP family quinone oxidoreductase [Desulforhopalus singaporensis]|uniref:Putative quinone oxidoreductase, YhdH/YhfP family n=1 Tax=Desulforhopalus singaporensis TaxID=91360 RepID=A0A1H0MKN2_9BACT|nr:YhdH/YhfP family quinone oxidoreductase [Desulforhopalus singaporensis]SDO81018.1 putative quinone oxidoreductase, YhdH/YhfP family [Desulforhopalus singaporensis]
METVKFRAMVVEQTGENSYRRSIQYRTLRQLPEGDVLIRVAYSSLNYKDALSATGNRGVTRNFPHTPGIDCAGVVESSRLDRFKQGDRVIVTSYDLGMNTAGGFGEYIRVPGDWVVSLPDGLSLRDSMVYGTAGLAAAMSVYALVKTVKPEDGDVLVTGASGGVGSIAVALLAKLNYRVVAVTGKKDAAGFLTNLGAAGIISRQEALAGSDKPIGKALWAGVVDTVGGEILASALKSTGTNGVVTCCGNVASAELAINVYPFILRGVSLVGIDTQNCPMDHRVSIWNRLAGDWKIDRLQELAREVGLDRLSGEIDRILHGEQRGRVVIHVNEDI